MRPGVCMTTCVAQSLALRRLSIVIMYKRTCACAAPKEHQEHGGCRLHATLVIMHMTMRQSPSHYALKKLRHDGEESKG